MYYTEEINESYIKNGMQEHDERGEMYLKKTDISRLKALASEVNIADKLDKGELAKIGRDVVEEAKRDDLTRNDWFETYNEALSIARQKMDVKSYPFDKASNVKIPLILEGCIQFNARLMPEIVRNGKTVNVAIIGTPSVFDEQLATQISNHMSLQTLKTIKNWVSDTDKMFMALPLIGSVFKKIVYDPINRRPACYLCLPTEVIINNEVSSIETAPRITHVIKLSKNDVIERMKAGLFRKLDLQNLEKEYGVEGDNKSDDEERVMPSDLENSSNYYVFYEQILYRDLDKDGYAEPYIATVLKNTSQVFRLVAAYNETNFIFNKQRELVKINPDQYYADQIFLPSPDGTFLGMGFGQLLLQLNTAINSIANNLIDAGTFANLRAGFVGRDLRIQKGESSFSPGEWKIVNNTLGQNIANSIFPLPFSEPSQTLFSLLQFLVEFGRQTANISDILMGNPISAQMPATSVVTLVEQGAKIFNSILTRVYEGLKKEFNILYQINKKYFQFYPEKDLMTKDGYISELAYAQDKYDIFPVANPALGTDAVRLAKMQVLLQMMESPMINKQEVLKRYFDALGIAEPEKLFVPIEELNKPTPEGLLMQSQIELGKAQTAKTMAEANTVVPTLRLKALEADIDEKRMQIEAIAKGGEIGSRKVDAATKLATTDAQVSKINTDLALQKVETEVAKSTPKIDTSNIEQGLQNVEGNQPVMSDNSHYRTNEGQPQQGDENANDQGESASEITPQISDLLKDVSMQQQQGQM